jgi:predicted nucleic acid-binding protein
MKIVIDTNIIFSSLLHKDAKQRRIILSKEFQFYSPNYTLFELFKYKERIMGYSKASEADVYEYFSKIIGNIRFINSEFISPKNRKYAYELCKDTDESDSPFIALTIELNALLWTGDKKLKETLIKKGFYNFFAEK